MKLLTKSFLILLMTTCWFTTARAADASASLNGLLEGMHTMQADFTQTLQEKSAKRLQQTRGHMAIEHPGKFRWDIKSPNAQLIIANGSRLWIYDKDLEQVTIRNFNQAAGQTPALLLSDNKLLLNKDFNVQEGRNIMHIANYRIFLLTPKSSDDPFELIKLTFIDQRIHDMQLEDRIGHVTTIAFKNVRTGMALPAKLFTFKPPADTDVIDETKNARD